MLLSINSFSFLHKLQKWFIENENYTLHKQCTKEVTMLQSKLHKSRNSSKKSIGHLNLKQPTNRTWFAEYTILAPQMNPSKVPRFLSIQMFHITQKAWPPIHQPHDVYQSPPLFLFTNKLYTHLDEFKFKSLLFIDS